MKRLTVKRSEVFAPPPSRAASAVVLPELRFRAMAPVEGLITLAREQDELFRSVLSVDLKASEVAIERREHDDGARFHVLVRAWVRGSERCGCFDHAAAAIALRTAYSDLLRAVVQETACPCSAAA